MIKRIKKEIKDFGPSFKKLHFVEKVLASLFLFVVVVSVFNIYFKTQNVEANACYNPLDCPITGYVSGGNGSISSASPNQYGTAELAYMPASGYELNKITGSGGACFAAYRRGGYIVVDNVVSRCSVTITFSLIYVPLPNPYFHVYSITSGTGSGTVSATGSYQMGRTVPARTATASSGSTFDGWIPTYCGSKFTMGDGDVTCTAKFDLPITVTVTAKPTSVTYVAPPNGNSSFITWTSINATSCIRKDTGASVPLNGSFNSDPLYKATTFTIECYN